MDTAGTTSAVLFLVLAASWVFFYRWWKHSTGREDAAVERATADFNKQFAALNKAHMDNIKELKAAHKAELQQLEASLLREHNSQYAALSARYADLATSVPQVLSQVVQKLLGHVEDFRRLYDILAAIKSDHGENGTEISNILTTIITTLNFIPQLIEAAVSKAMEKKAT